MSRDLKDRRSVRGDATKESILEAARESSARAGLFGHQHPGGSRAGRSPAVARALPLRQQAGSARRRARAREREAPRAPAGAVRRLRAVEREVARGLPLPGGRPRVRLRPDPVGAVGGRARGRGARSALARRHGRLAPADGRGLRGVVAGGGARAPDLRGSGRHARRESLPGSRGRDPRRRLRGRVAAPRGARGGGAADRGHRGRAPPADPAPLRHTHSRCVSQSLSTIAA